MIAIQTKVLPGTETKGTKIKAWTSNKQSITIPYPHDLSNERAHFAAVQALVAKHKLEWDLSEMRWGGVDHGYVFCFADSIVKTAHKSQLCEKLEREIGLACSIHRTDLENAEVVAFIVAAYASGVSLEMSHRIFQINTGSGGWEPVHICPVNFADFAYRTIRIKPEYQPKTGEACGCRPGNQRDNCPTCEGTGQKIDFAAIRSR